jgi:hypothetical protein
MIPMDLTTPIGSLVSNIKIYHYNDEGGIELLKIRRNLTDLVLGNNLAKVRKCLEDQYNLKISI